MASLYAAKTGLPEGRITAMMDKETWLSAAEAKALGFVDSVVDEGKEAPTVTLATAELHAFYTAQIFSPAADPAKNPPKMPTQEEFDAEKAARVAAETQVATLTQRLAAMEMAQATELVEASIAAGKITASAKDSTIAFAATNYTAAKAMIDGIVVPTAQVAAAHRSVADAIAAAANGGTPAVSAERAAWTIRDWEKRDDAGLAKMKATNAPLYEALFVATYGQAPK